MGSMGKLFWLIFLMSGAFLLLPARMRSQSLEWTWVSGSNTPGGAAVYGPKGLLPGDLRPGARQGSSMWIDKSGKIWVFGGLGIEGLHNDLWKYDPVSGFWTWVAGDSTGSGKAGSGEASYGLLNYTQASNLPGGRYGQSGWVDNSGNFWIFGGTGYDNNGRYGLLNDLWKYDPVANLWTWVSGSDTINGAANYGTFPGFANFGNVPGARSFSSSWVDQSGNFWVFGGDNSPTSTGGAPGTVLLNDLWKYDPVGNQWTWVSGGNSSNARGNYGTEGNPSASNVPGARYRQSGMMGHAGKFWIFGGQGYDGNGRPGFLNDLWEYDPGTNQWTWVSGDDTANSFGSYHFTLSSNSVINHFDTRNKPGARCGQAGWLDSAGNIWIFGGQGYGNSRQQLGYLNDIWVYNPQGNEWAVHGFGDVDTIGIYGGKGSASLAYIPASRIGAVGMADASDNYWIFGGIDVNGNTYNDLWKGTDPWRSVVGSENSLFQLAWVSGDSSVNSPGNHGLQGPWPTNAQPGKREYHSSWKDNYGKFWIFGGQDNHGNAYNDLWEFDPSTGWWYWMAGDSTPNSNGVYGVKGSAAPGSTPGARAGQVAWVDRVGNFYIYGGGVFNGSGVAGYLDDVWKYFPNTRQWAWSGGDSTLNQPGSRMNAAVCVDKSTGLFWVYGGHGIDSKGNIGTLADIWKFDSTGAGSWALGSGTADIYVAYGPLNVEGNSYTPGSREGASIWTYYPPNAQNPTQGNLYLFGGQNAIGQVYNDVWELVYDPIELTLEWAWVGGSNLPHDPGNYGTLGVGSVLNFPPSRSGQITIQDAAENIWIYGGLAGGLNAYSDLWKYTPADGKFTWMGGPAKQNYLPVFGTQGVQTANAQPGARQGQSGWMDNSGNIWLMGGLVPQVTGVNYPYNDLWKLTSLLGNLPIKEVLLSGVADGHENLLSWETIDELNTDHFVVQRSIDGIGFDSIAVIAAAGSGNNSYSFTDLRLPASSVFFYRLSMVDKDGSAGYSQTIILHAAPAAGLCLYPDPARDMVTLQLKDNSLVNTPLSVLDIGGHLIREVLITGQQQTIDLSGLARGIYLLRLVNGSTLRFLKE